MLVGRSYFRQLPGTSVSGRRERVRLPAAAERAWCMGDVFNVAPWLHLGDEACWAGLPWGMSDAAAYARCCSWEFGSAGDPSCWVMPLLSYRACCLERWVACDPLPPPVGAAAASAWGLFFAACGLAQRLVADMHAAGVAAAVQELGNSSAVVAAAVVSFAVTLEAALRTSLPSAMTSGGPAMSSLQELLLLWSSRERDIANVGSSSKSPMELGLTSESFDAAFARLVGLRDAMLNVLLAGDPW